MMQGGRDAGDPAGPGGEVEAGIADRGDLDVLVTLGVDGVEPEEREEGNPPGRCPGPRWGSPPGPGRGYRGPAPGWPTRPGRPHLRSPAPPGTSGPAGSQQDCPGSGGNVRSGGGRGRQAEGGPDPPGGRRPVESVEVQPRGAGGEEVGAQLRGGGHAEAADLGRVVGGGVEPGPERGGQLRPRQGGEE